MIINVPLVNPKLAKEKKRAYLKFVDIEDHKEEYNVFLVIEEKRGQQWVFGTLEILGYAMKLDIKRLAKAS